MPLPSAQQFRNPGTFGSCGVGGVGRNAQFYFGARVNFTPNYQFAPDQFGAFPHAGQAKVPFAPASRQNRLINAFTVILQAHPELLIVIPDFHLDLLCRSVVECVSESLSGNPVDFVTQDRMQLSRFAFNGDAKCRRAANGWIICEFLSELIDGPCEIVRLHCASPVSLYRIPALGDCIRGLVISLSSSFFTSTGALSGINCETNFEPQH